MQGLGERHGEIVDTLRRLADFQLFRLTPDGGVFVMGFGQAYAIDAQLESCRQLQRTAD